MSLERERKFEEPDERLLQYLFDTQSALPPPAIAWNLPGDGVSAVGVERRLTRLERAGLVERAGVDREQKRDYYRITDDGVAYLGGLFDPAADEETE